MKKKSCRILEKYKSNWIFRMILRLIEFDIPVIHSHQFGIERRNSEKIFYIQHVARFFVSSNGQSC